MRGGSRLLAVCGFLLLPVALSACGAADEENGETAGPTATAPAAAERTVVPGQPTAAETGEAMTPATAPRPEGAVNAMAVDADPETPEVDDSTTQAVGAPFDVSINVASALADYNVYQFQLQWSPGTSLSFVEGTHLNREGFSACFDFIREGSTGVSSACGIPAVLSLAEGAMTTLTLQCEEQGDVELHLVTVTEDDQRPTATIDEAGFIPTNTTDARVTCQ